MVLENTGNEIRCIFFKLVVPDKRIVVRSEDLAGLSILFQLQTNAQKGLTVAPLEGSDAKISGYFCRMRLEVDLSSITIGNVPELKNNRLTGSTRQRAPSSTFVRLIAQQIMSKLRPARFSN